MDPNFANFVDETNQNKVKLKNIEEQKCKSDDEQISSSSSDDKSDEYEKCKQKYQNTDVIEM